MDGEASEREIERERERRMSLAAKLPMEELRKQMAEIRTSMGITQDELQTCGDALTAEFLHACFDRLGIARPTAPQDAIPDPKGLPLDSSGNPKPMPVGRRPCYLMRVLDSQLSNGIRAGWIRLAEKTGWKAREKDSIESNSCAAALHLTLFNYGVDTNHPLYKKLYDQSLVDGMHTHLRRNQSISLALVQMFQKSWLGKVESSGSAGNQYIELGWLQGRELELNPSIFEQLVTGFLLKRLGQQGPEGWENKPPETSSAARPSRSPRDASVLSEEASGFDPDGAVFQSFESNMDLGESSSTRPRSASGSVPLGDGAAAGKKPRANVRRNTARQVNWGISTVDGQPLDNWLVEQNTKGLPLAAMADVVDIGTGTLRKRLNALAKVEED